MPISVAECYTFRMDIKDVENLAELARIYLGEDETTELLEDMKVILDYVRQVAEVEVEESEVEFSLVNVWREDVIELRDFSKDLITGQFPQSKSGFLKVKKIL